MNEDKPKQLKPEDYEDVYCHPELLIPIEELIPEKWDKADTYFFRDEYEDYTD